MVWQLATIYCLPHMEVQHENEGWQNLAYLHREPVLETISQLLLNPQSINQQSNDQSTNQLINPPGSTQEFYVCQSDPDRISKQVIN